MTRLKYWLQLIRGTIREGQIVTSGHMALLDENTGPIQPHEVEEVLRLEASYVASTIGYCILALTEVSIEKVNKEGKVDADILR